LVHAAICAGIFNDLGSGGNVDITILTRGKTEILRNYDRPTPRQFKSGFVFPRGSTRKPPLNSEN
jgi:20S proteasome subunit beta 2